MNALFFLQNETFCQEDAGIEVKECKSFKGVWVEGLIKLEKPTTDWIHPQVYIQFPE